MSNEVKTVFLRRGRHIYTVSVNQREKEKPIKTVREAAIRYLICRGVTRLGSPRYRRTAGFSS